MTPPLVFEASEENFNALVLENSVRGPVLLNFWAPNAGPCLRLYPVLERLVLGLDGRLLLVNVNVEDMRRCAREYGVTSLPTLKIVRRGEVIDTVHGFRPEEDLRRIIERHAGSARDRLIAGAVALYRRGDVDTAFTRLAEAAVEDPGDLRIPLILAKLLAREQRIDEARRILSTLGSEGRADPSVRNLRAHLDMLAAAGRFGDLHEAHAALDKHPHDLDIRFAYAAHCVLADEYDTAFEVLMELRRRDRGYRDGLAHACILAVADVVGRDHPAARRALGQLIDAP